MLGVKAHLSYPVLCTRRCLILLYKQQLNHRPCHRDFEPKPQEHQFVNNWYINDGYVRPGNNFPSTNVVDRGHLLVFAETITLPADAAASMMWIFYHACVIPTVEVLIDRPQPQLPIINHYQPPLPTIYINLSSSTSIKPPLNQPLTHKSSPWPEPLPSAQCLFPRRSRLCWSRERLILRMNIEGSPLGECALVKDLYL